MSRYHNPAMKLLRDQQVKFAPRDVRLAQLERAEDVLETLDPKSEYRFQDLHEKITSFRPEAYPDVVLAGDAAVHDLRCFVEDLSDSMSIPVESVSEEVWTVEDVSKRFNVSTKTVDRWRDRGLSSRRFLFGGRRRVGFLKSVVEKFVDRHAAEVERGQKFSQLTDEEREEIVARARRLARDGMCPTEVAHHLGKQLGRSVEAVRYTLKRHDRDFPKAAVFPDANDPLSDESRRAIYRRHREGASIESLEVEFHRSRSSIHRIVAETRAQLILDQPIEFMFAPIFEADNADELILTNPPVVDKKGAPMKPPPGLPPYLVSLYSIPLLSGDEEVYHFRKMNYLKFKASKLRESIDPAKPSQGVMDQVESLLEESLVVKNLLIRSNLRLVVSIAKRHVKPTTNFFEMVSDGNLSLIRAIEKFDFTRGFKFSTYASWAIMKNFARSIPAENSLMDRFRTGSDEVFQSSSDPRSESFQSEINVQKQHSALLALLDRLDSREREIILLRYGLAKGTAPQTLEQVGARLGVTKERIRQIESRTLQKLRQIATRENLEIPGI